MLTPHACAARGRRRPRCRWRGGRVPLRRPAWGSPGPVLLSPHCNENEGSLGIASPASGSPARRRRRPDRRAGAPARPAAVRGHAQRQRSEELGAGDVAAAGGPDRRAEVADAVGAGGTLDRVLARARDAAAKGEQDDAGAVRARQCVAGDSPCAPRACAAAGFSGVGPGPVGTPARSASTSTMARQAAHRCANARVRLRVLLLGLRARASALPRVPPDRAARVLRDCRPGRPFSV